MAKKRKMTPAESGQMGGKATYQKHGSEHMRRIGSKGFWAALESAAVRYPSTVNYNPYRNLLANLMAKKRR